MHEPEKSKPQIIEAGYEEGVYPNLMVGEFVTAKLSGKEDYRQGWIINQYPLRIKGQSGKEYLCEDNPVRVINPPPKEKSELDEDYEEGVMTVHVPIKKKWYQFWLPKNIDYDYCRYTKIGNMVKITIEGGKSFTG